MAEFQSGLVSFRLHDPDCDSAIGQHLLENNQCASNIYSAILSVCVSVLIPLKLL